MGKLWKKVEKITIFKFGKSTINGPYLIAMYIIYIYIVLYLVGGIPTPLKNMNESVGIMTFPIYGNIKFMFQTTIQDWSKMPGYLWVTDPMDLLYSILFGFSNSNCLETFFFLIFLVYPPFLDEPI